MALILTIIAIVVMTHGIADLLIRIGVHAAVAYCAGFLLLWLLVTTISRLRKRK